MKPRRTLSILHHDTRELGYDIQLHKNFIYGSFSFWSLKSKDKLSTELQSLAEAYAWLDGYKTAMNRRC